MAPTTLFDKIWDAHEVAPGLLYIDLHLVHEVTSPQAFDGLRLAGRPVRRPDRTLATADHNVPTDGTPVAARIRDVLSPHAGRDARAQLRGVRHPLLLAGLGAPGHRPRHRPRARASPSPGMTIVCGDSHTATHGAFGALAFGIGTSEVEHVLATQMLVQRKPRSMRDPLRGRPRLRRHGQGPDPRHDRPDGRRRRRRPRRRVRRARRRGAHDGGPDDRLQHDDRGRRPRGHGRARRDDLRLGRRARRRVDPAWRELRTDAGATLRQGGRRRRRRAQPDGQLGHEPGAGRRRHRRRARARQRGRGARAGLHGPRGRARRSRTSSSTASSSARAPTRASATCARRPRSSRAAGWPTTSTRWSSPAPCRSSAQAEAEGLDEVFRAAGFDWRGAGCSMCLGMNPDIAAPGERCASTSNRNFEGRQGRGGRTTSSARRWPPPPRSRGTSSTSASWDEARWSRSRPITGPRRRPGPRRRRHRPDHPQAVPQARGAHGLRPVPLLRLGQGARLGPAAPTRSSCRAELRLRLEPRARALGARGLRLPRGHRAELRRHLPLELHEDRAAAGRARAGRGAGAWPPPAHAEVDLAAQEVRWTGRRRARRAFDIDREVKHRLLNGLDDIALTLQQRRARSPPTSATASARGPVTTACLTASRAGRATSSSNADRVARIGSAPCPPPAAAVLGLATRLPLRVGFGVGLVAGCVLALQVLLTRFSRLRSSTTSASCRSRWPCSGPARGRSPSTSARTGSTRRPLEAQLARWAIVFAGPAR